MSQPAGYDCPGCGTPSGAIIGQGQAMCFNESCAILMWDPAKTPEELMADMHHIDLRGWLGED